MCVAVLSLVTRGAGNTLYPEKKLMLDKKSPVDRLDLAPPSYETYKKTYPGLTTAFGAP